MIDIICFVVVSTVVLGVVNSMVVAIEDVDCVVVDVTDVVVGSEDGVVGVKVVGSDGMGVFCSVVFAFIDGFKFSDTSEFIARKPKSSSNIDARLNLKTKRITVCSI